MNSCISLSILLSGLIPAIISSIIIGLFYLYQFKLFKKQMKEQNDVAIKASSFSIILKKEEEFDNIHFLKIRKELASKIITEKLLDKESFDYKNVIGRDIENVFDFFTTIGFYIDNKYLLPDIAWNHFDYFFRRYYAFYTMYNIKEQSGYEDTAWNNLEKLKKYFDETEIQKSKTGNIPIIDKEELKNFFSEEAK
jgi:hypothetical protein